MQLLALAIALRVNFYQKEYLAIEKCDVKNYASMYWEGEDYIVKTTVKDVCDKIIHADVFEKSVLPKDVSTNAYETIQMKGTKDKKKWVLNLCVAIFCEKILYLLEQCEEQANNV